MIDDDRETPKYPWHEWNSNPLSYRWLHICLKTHDYWKLYSYSVKLESYCINNFAKMLR
jgi:hypothetical protein